MASKSKVAAVVKANAYGHGSANVAKALEDEVEIFCVARVHEAISLREQGIKKDILVFTPITESTASLYVMYNLIATVSDMHCFKLLPEQTRVHINIDTGMGRVGFMTHQLNELSSLVKNHESRLKIEGLYSHFSDAESPERSLTKEQQFRFQEVVEHFKNRSWNIHFANSAATANLPKSHYTMVRSGIALYGYDDGFRYQDRLQAIMRWQSEIVECRKVKEGWPISYGATWQVKEAGYVGVIPVGYADGLFRGLSNKIYFADANSGKRYPQIGRITMDHTMVWLGENPVKLGTEIDLLNGNAMNAVEWAQILGTIPYEIVCALSDRVERRFI